MTDKISEELTAILTFSCTNQDVCSAQDFTVSFLDIPQVVTPFFRNYCDKVTTFSDLFRATRLIFHNRRCSY